MKTRDPIRLWGSALGVTAFGLALAVAAVQAQPAKPVTVPKSPSASATPLTDAERKTVEELQVAQKRLDTDAARVMAASPDGRRRVAEAIASQFGVPDNKIVNDLRARRMGYGEVTIALALAHQLTKRDRTLTQHQALDKLVARRKAAQGWGVVARDLGLKLGDVISDVKKADKQLAKLDAVRLARAERQDTTARADKPSKPEKVDRTTR